MDSFELNKIVGAILGTLLFVMGVGFLAEAVYHPAESAGIGYALPGEVEAGDDSGQPPPVAVLIGTLLASADPTAGQASAKKCQSCHDFTQGGPNKTGPNLYDVVERLIGSHEGFAYSSGMLAHKDAGDTWTYDNLNAFITTPKAFTPGTKMTFAGVKNDQERANIIAYLSTLSQSPKPFPAADAPMTEGGAPAEGQTVEPAAEAPAQTPSVETPSAMDAPGETSSEAPSSEPSSAPAP